MPRVFEAAYVPEPPTRPRYRRRDPESTTLHTAIRTHLEPFVEHLRREGGALPDFVLRELRAYLRCGVLAHGFQRLACNGCGGARLVGFSCGARTVCPSCGGRRMADLAAHLVDRVLPWVPIRQWVLSLPWNLRLLVAYDHDLLLDCHRALVRSLTCWQRRRARVAGIADARCGAVAQIQRFSADLSLNPHLHLLTFDGCFHRPDPHGPPVFRRLPPPSDADVCAVVQGVARRMHRALVRRGIDPHDRRRLQTAAADLGEDEPVLAHLAAASAQGRLAVGRHAGLRPATLGVVPPPDGARRPPQARSRARQCAEADGYNLHAAVSVRDDQRDRLEHLCRYLARPPVANDRLSLLDDDTVALRLKRPRRSDGATHVLLHPFELLGRLSALVPRPFVNSTLYSGVLAGAAAWRAEVVPPPPLHDTPPADSPLPCQGRPPPRRRRTLPWADLLYRVFGIDALRCDECGGAYRRIAEIRDSEVAATILRWLALPDTALPIVPARPPPDEDAFDADDDADDDDDDDDPKDWQQEGFDWAA